MSQKTRIWIALGIILLIAAVMLGLEALRGRVWLQNQPLAEVTQIPGGIPIRLNSRLVASFTPADLDQLEKAQFTDAAEGKSQDGWRLADVLRLHVPQTLADATRITIRSSSRDKAVTLSWAEVRDPASFVMFDLSNRGTLKLVSVLPQLDTRDEWVQDADSIEIETP